MRHTRRRAQTYTVSSPQPQALLQYAHQNAGVTRERLEGFDRPVKGDPQWFDGKKDALIRDL